MYVTEMLLHTIKPTFSNDYLDARGWNNKTRLAVTYWNWLSWYSSHNCHNKDGKLSENTKFIHFIILTDENPIKNWELNCLEETEKESSQPVTTLSFSMQQEIKLNGDVEKKHLN